MSEKQTYLENSIQPEGHKKLNSVKFIVREVAEQAGSIKFSSIFCLHQSLL